MPVPRILLILLYVNSGLDAQTSTDSLFARAFRQRTFSHVRQVYLDSILAQEPANAYAWQQKSMPLFKQKKYELGMRYLDSAVKYDARLWLPYRAFIKCVFAKSYRSSIDDFLAAEQLFPGGIVMDHTYDFYRGMCHIQLNEFDAAIPLIAGSVNAGIARTGEGHFFEYFYLGIARMEKDDYAGAVREFDLALKTYPRFSDVKYYKALCLEKLGKWQEAKALMPEALADLDAGYTISEDSVIYEEFPYQLKRYWISRRAAPN
jgi:tetratricopeptide (TPR) repeat protein